MRMTARSGARVRCVTPFHREQTYFDASHALGYGGLPAMFRHILPHVSSPSLVQFKIDLGYAVLALAALRLPRRRSPPAPAPGGERAPHPPANPGRR